MHIPKIATTARYTETLHHDLFKAKGGDKIATPVCLHDGKFAFQAFFMFEILSAPFNDAIENNF